MTIIKYYQKLVLSLQTLPASQFAVGAVSAGRVSHLQVEVFESAAVFEQAQQSLVGEGNTAGQLQPLQGGAVAAEPGHRGITQLGAVRQTEAAQAREPHHVGHADVADTAALGQVQLHQT